jgi:hypothetical protein
VSNNNVDLTGLYKTTPYPAYVHGFSHPGHVAAVATLYGLSPPDPTHARVLEISSASGRNLRWIARSLPHSRCLGIDLVVNETQDEMPRNVCIVEADILDYDFGEDRFDYIIAHGFLSWVPENVQQRLFEVCRDYLTTNGVALISYNTMPGCLVRDSLRRLLLYELSGVDQGGEKHADQKSQMGAVSRVLEFFAKTLPMPGVSQLPHADLLQSNVEALRNKISTILLHDEAGLIYEPLYLLQFSMWAAETNLAYVADADLGLDWMGIYPKSLRQAIVDFELPRLKALQYVDYVFNSSFRKSLVCRKQDAGSLLPSPDYSALDRLWISTHVQAMQPVTSLNSAEKYGDRAQKQVPEVTDPLIESLFETLAHAPPAGMPFRDALIAAWNSTNPGQSLPGDIPQSIGRCVLESVVHGRMSLSCGPVPVAETGTKE